MDYVKDSYKFTHYRHAYDVDIYHSRGMNERHRQPPGMEDVAALGSFVSRGYGILAMIIGV